MGGDEHLVKYLQGTDQVGDDAEAQVGQNPRQSDIEEQKNGEVTEK